MVKDSEILYNLESYFTLRDLNDIHSRSKPIDSRHFPKYVKIANGIANVSISVYTKDSAFKLTSIPVNFGKIAQNFSIEDNSIRSLKGGPSYVGGRIFSCSNNHLTSLEQGPEIVGGNYYCDDNKLITLKGAPVSIPGSFFCRNNNLTSIEYLPKCTEPHESVKLDYVKNMGLLSLIPSNFDYVEIGGQDNDNLIDILQKHMGRSITMPLKKEILLCQKELIDNGFIGNASW
jgi:hypothetical protein